MYMTDDQFKEWSFKKNEFLNDTPVDYVFKNGLKSFVDMVNSKDKVFLFEKVFI